MSANFVDILMGYDRDETRQLPLAFALVLMLKDLICRSHGTRQSRRPLLHTLARSACGLVVALLFDPYTKDQ